MTTSGRRDPQPAQLPGQQPRAPAPKRMRLGKVKVAGIAASAVGIVIAGEESGLSERRSDKAATQLLP